MESYEDPAGLDRPPPAREGDELTGGQRLERDRFRPGPSAPPYTPPLRDGGWGSRSIPAGLRYRS
jgi:hypothetical protein